MPTAEARLTTDRASRYLVQLCRHLGQMNHPTHPGRTTHRPPGGHGGTPSAAPHVDHTDNHGTVRFPDGRWTLDATADALTLRVDATDEAALRRLQDAIADRIETIGRRDGLQVRWQQRTDNGTPPQASS